MSDTKRIVGVVGAGVLVATVGFFLVTSLTRSKGSGGDKDAATKWAAHWAKARACIVGTKPYASSGTMAIELREAHTLFIDDVLKRCVLSLETTRRPAGHSGNNKKMEQLWIDVETAVTKLEDAIRVRLDGFARKHIDKIGNALNHADAQAARLAEAVGNPVATFPSQPKELAALKTKPLRWKSGRVHTHRQLRQVGSSLLAETHEPKKLRQRLFVINAPAEVDMRVRSLEKARPGAIYSYLVAGMWVQPLDQPDSEDTKEGADAKGKPVTAAKPPADTADAGVPDAPEFTHAVMLRVGDEDVVVTKATDSPKPKFHLHEGDVHIVGWDLRGTLVVVESVDAGKTWEQRYSSERDWRIDQLSWSRVALVTSGGSPSYVMADVKAKEREWAPKPIAEAASLTAGVLSCYADKNTTWWLLPGGPRKTRVVRDVAGTMTVLPVGKVLSAISSCTADKFVGVGPTASTGDAPLVVCTAKSCGHAFDIRPAGAVHIGAVVTAKGEVVAAVHRHRILSVWRAGKRSYHRLRTKAALRRLAVFGDRVYGVLQQGTKLRTVDLTDVR